MELKVLDSTANPYIALTAVVTAGMLGMEQSTKLPASCQIEPSSQVHVSGDQLWTCLWPQPPSSGISCPDMLCLRYIKAAVGI